MNGNSIKYSVCLTERKKNNRLKGKKIIFLGSSVTYGSQSKGESFVDFLKKADGIEAVKEAVSGTTLADNGFDQFTLPLTILPQAGKLGMVDRKILTDKAKSKQ